MHVSVPVEYSVQLHLLLSHPIVRFVFSLVKAVCGPFRAFRVVFAFCFPFQLFFYFWGAPKIARK